MNAEHNATGVVKLHGNTFTFKDSANGRGIHARSQLKTSGSGGRLDITVLNNTVAAAPGSTLQKLADGIFIQTKDTKIETADEP